MITEEEIARAITEARSQKPLPPDFDWAAEMERVREFERQYPGYITGFSMGTDALRMARAVLALVQPAIDAAVAGERPGTYFANLLQREWIGPDGIRYEPTRERPADFVEF